MKAGSLHFQSALDSAKGQSVPWLKIQRDEAFHRFQVLGWPTTRHEEWRYTPLSALHELNFVHETSAPSLAVEALHALAGPPLGHRLVFVNGRFQKQLSTLQQLPFGVEVLPLAEAWEKHPERFHAPLAEDGRSLTALNTALAQEGAVIAVAAGVQVDVPMELLFVATSPHAFACHPRNYVFAEERASLTLLETFVSTQASPYFMNVVTAVEVANNAQVRHYRFQSESADAIHLGLVHVTQGRDSQFLSHVVQSGARLGRHEVRVDLAAEGAHTQLQGLYLGQGAQLLDNHTVVNHLQPHCSSDEVFKGILSGHAHGVFNGKVVVQKNAVGTNAKQLNRNLILSEGALVDTRPQLEIYADDVKCSHGATVGRLDEKALFYLRSRGIPRDVAMNMLTFAFAKELVKTIEWPAYRARIEKLVSSKLPGGTAMGEWA